MGMLIDTNIEEKLRDEWSVNLHRIIHFCYKLVFQTRTKWVWGFFLMRENEKVWIGKAWLKRQYGVYYKWKLMFYKDFLKKKIYLYKYRK